MSLRMSRALNLVDASNVLPHLTHTHRCPAKLHLRCAACAGRVLDKQEAEFKSLSSLLSLPVVDDGPGESRGKSKSSEEELAKKMTEARHFQDLQPRMRELVSGVLMIVAVVLGSLRMLSIRKVRAPEPGLCPCTSTPLRRCAAAPLRRCAAAPLHLCTSAPLHLCTSTAPLHLRVQLCSHQGAALARREEMAAEAGTRAG